MASSVGQSLRDAHFVVPIRIDDTPFTDLPIQLHQLNALDFSVDRTAALHMLVRSLPAVSGRENGSEAEAKTDGRRLPSIGVLPFQNMSGDPEQDYFADGVVEDIITALSRFRSIW